MRRWTTGLVLGLGLLAAGPARADDRVLVRDRSAKTDKPATLSGQITAESINGIKLQPIPAGAAKDVPATDVVDVIYDVGGAIKLDYDNVLRTERKPLAQVLKEHQDLAARAKADPRLKALARHLQFRVAMLKANLASDEAGKADAKKLTADAVEALSQFKKDHPKSWQLTAAVQELANLQLDNNQPDEALKTMEELAQNPDLNKEAKREVGLLVVDLLLRARNYPEAERRVSAALATAEKDDPAAARLQIYTTGLKGATAGSPDEAVKALEETITKTSDPALKALAYNMLGELYTAKDQKRDALWEYLWVDVVYNQDRQEHAKALDRLVRLFTEFKDEPRARYYEDKLRRMR
jgi:predicted negative regulator of RcsB-dependent stress response